MASVTSHSPRWGISRYQSGDLANSAKCKEFVRIEYPFYSAEIFALFFNCDFKWNLRGLILQEVIHSFVTWYLREDGIWQLTRNMEWIVCCKSISATVSNWNLVLSNYLEPLDLRQWISIHDARNHQIRGKIPENVLLHCVGIHLWFI